MHANPAVIPTMFGAAVLFWIGATLERRAVAATAKAALWFLGILLAMPALLFAAYYAHLFDNAAWFYNLRTISYSELAGCGLGFLAGLVHSWWQPESFGEKAVCPAVL